MLWYDKGILLKYVMKLIMFIQRGLNLYTGVTDVSIVELNTSVSCYDIACASSVPTYLF